LWRSCFPSPNPLELRVETIAAGINTEEQSGIKKRDSMEEGDIRANADDVTAELVRLLEDRAGSQPLDEPE
jgi:hypothetical protein